MITTNDGEQVFSVSEYTEYINHIVSLDSVIIEGEVSNFRDISGRNFCYFDIKDENATARCFQGFWHSAKVALSNGTMIKVFGHPSLQKNGTFVIDVREVFLIGKGALMQAYLKLKTRLEKEGLFDPAIKKPLPVFPKTVGLIAGKNSSAYHDVAAEISERWSGAHIFFLASKVQGMNAKREIISAIKHFNQKHPVDILIVARGGGSMEDLQAFDSEEVVREIFSSKIPIISAIGHEDHRTLSDFVSDVRAKTPTKAAQIAVPDRKEITERLEYFSQRLHSLISHQLEQSHAKLEGQLTTLNLLIHSKIEKIIERLDEKKIALSNFVCDLIRGKQQIIERLEKSLMLLDPFNVLKRGYGVIEKKGKRISSVEQIKMGDEVTTTLHDGAFRGKIVDIVE